MIKIDTNSYILESSDILKIFQDAFYKDNFYESTREIFLILKDNVDDEIMNLISFKSKTAKASNIGKYGFNISFCFSTKDVALQPDSNEFMTDISGLIKHYIYFNLGDDKRGLIINLDDDQASYFKMKYL